MFSKEKLVTRFNIAFRNLFYHIFFWNLSLLLYVFLTNNSVLFTSYFNLLKVESVYLILAILGAGIGIFFTFLDTLFSDRLLRLSPIKAIVFLRSLLYFVLGFLLIVLASITPTSLILPTDYTEFKGLLPAMDADFARFMVFFFLVSYLNNLFRSMIKIVGRGNFRNWLFGMLNKPREEERIFMFIDMKASTTIAEKLQHRKFSHLVQDVFNDMAIVDNYMGDIYQYLGDGAIISWSLKGGLRNNNFVKAFFAFKRVVERRSRYYQRKYGLKPQFKAGMHVGKIMVLQVGRIRRDISYNGDTLNTTARIESMCGEYKQDLLISGTLHDLMTDKAGFTLKNIGNIQLKGKRKGVDIYQVRKRITKKK